VLFRSSNLNTKIDNLSGYVNSQDNNISTNLYNTGSTLDIKINTLSGYTDSQDTSISNNLRTTGSTLDAKINDLSGYVNTQDNSISNNLISTGSTLDNKINSLSGSSVLLYGNQSIGGIKTFRDNVYINNLYVTGTETIVNTAQINLASNYLLLNVTGGAVDGGIFFVTGSGFTGVNDSGPIIGFDHSNKFKFGISTRNSDLSTLPDIASVQQIEAYSGFVDGKYATIVNLASTGSTLDTKINNLSGYSNNIFSTITNLALTGSTLTINLASTGSTLNSSINSLSGTLTSNYATITNLASTGSTLQTNINNLSGYINSSSSNIVFTTGNQTISGTKTFIQDTTFGDSAQGDFLVISGNNFIVYGSGNFTSGLFVNSSPVLTGSSTLYATSVNLASTGSTLDTKINNLSGVSVLTFGDQTISGNKTFNNTITIRAISGLSGIGGADSISLNGIDNAYNIFSSNFAGGNVKINGGSGNFAGGYIYLHAGKAGNTSYGGGINVNGNIYINNTNSSELASRTIDIYKTGIAFGNPVAINALTIDNNNISLNTPNGGGAGFGLLISGVPVTPASYATITNLASTGSSLYSQIENAKKLAIAYAIAL
jgi:hypothetical protein